MRKAIVFAGVTLVFLLAAPGLAQDSTDPQLGAYFIEWGTSLSPPYHVKNIVDSGAADHQESSARIDIVIRVFNLPYQAPDLVTHLQRPVF